MDNGYQAWNWRWAKLLLQEWHKSRFPWHGHHVVLYFCTFAIGIFCSFFKSDYFFLNSRGYQFSILFPYLDWYIECFYFSSLINFLQYFKSWRDNLIKILQPCVVSNHLDDNQIGCYDYFATIISSYVAIHVRCSLMNMICVAIQQHIEAWSTVDVNLY